MMRWLPTYAFRWNGQFPYTMYMYFLIIRKWVWTGHACISHNNCQILRSSIVMNQVMQSCRMYWKTYLVLQTAWPGPWALQILISIGHAFQPHHLGYSVLLQLPFLYSKWTNVVIFINWRASSWDWDSAWFCSWHTAWLKLIWYCWYAWLWYLHAQWLMHHAYVHDIYVLQIALSTPWINGNS